MFELLALVSAALFTGGALFVTIVEQPARLALDDGAMLTEWRRSYDRAAPMQAGLALLTGALGLAAWWTTSHFQDLIGAALILSCWPFVLLIVMPINRRLKALGSDGLGEARQLVERWGRLHAIRTLLGAASTLAFALALPIG
jgi:hypothetical protein